MKAAFGWDDSAVLGVQPDAVQAPVVAPPPATVNGTSGNDFIHVSGDGLTAPQGYTDLPDATDGNDIINPMAGNDIVHAGGGNDDINMQGYLTAADQIDGGDGTLDTVVLNGDYSAGVVFNASTMQNVELLDLTQGFSYKLILANGNFEVAGGGEFDLFAGTSASDSVYIDDTAETNANVLYQGSPGNDIFKAGGGQAYFQLQNGGNDTAIGGPGENTFAMGAALNAGDTLVGGSNDSVVILDGDYSQGLVLSASTITDMDAISFAAGHSYGMTMNDGNVAAGARLYIYANQLGASDGFTFNGAAEKDGHFNILPGRGADSVTGGAGDDVIEYDGGIALKAADHIDGGAGNDMLVLTSDYSAGFTFGAATMVNVETLSLLAGNSYKFTMNDANVGAGQTLTVDASTLSAGNHLTFFGQAETNGSYDIIGGADSDTIFTGAGNDQIDLSKGGDDIANGEGGDDVSSWAAR